MFYLSHRALEMEERAIKFSCDLKSLPCEHIHGNALVLLKLLFVVLQKVAVRTMPRRQAFATFGKLFLILLSYTVY